jgi:hypothetical protein
MREESRDRTNFNLFEILASRQERRKCEAITNCFEEENMDRPYLVPMKVNTTRNRFSVRSIFGHDLLTIWSPPHCLTQPKVREQSAFPSLTTALICGYWRFSIVDGKTHCALNHGT